MMTRRLKLVTGDPSPRGDPLEAWVRVAIRWQVAGLYLCVAWLEMVECELLGRSEP
jgi:hypothetical protein